jgi:phosphomannomutase
MPYSIYRLLFQIINLFYYNGIEIIPNNGKVYIHKQEFKIYRLVAEVFCENTNCDMYDTVHHIGDNYVDNAKNLLFVTKFQHDKIYKMIHGCTVG